ncbi:YadA C-terminal domain-containing protein [Aggregatibacter kilianii]|uniref:YadA C-terminal domain-containing protein n=1 Tax=Aggregatibacter kilianii TaxID=2025884 RepID=UPI000D691CFD|nr:YadA C-terminal domain-containing protein [Aggregatibacter kilianii]
MKKTILALVIATLSTNAYTNDVTGLSANTTASTLGGSSQANKSQAVNQALQNRTNESAEVNGIIYKDWAGTKNMGEVSVGSKGNERAISNIAAGEISTTSTEAVDGSQLYSVAYKVSENNYDIGLNKAIIDNHDTLIENNSGRLNSVEQLQTAHDVMIRDNTENIATLTLRTDDKDVTDNQQWDTIYGNTRTIENNSGRLNSVEQLQTAHDVMIRDNTENIATLTLRTDDKDVTDNQQWDTIYGNTRTIENNSGRLNSVEQLQTAHDVMIRDNTENITTLTQHTDEHNVTNSQQWNKIDGNTQAIATNTKNITVNRTQINTNRANIGKLSNGIPNINKRIDGLSDDIHKHRKLASAGIASVAAVANIPHATYAGKSALGVGVGGHAGQQALAVRYSRLSDNTKWLVSASAGVDTQSQVTYGAGLTYQFQ